MKITEIITEADKSAWQTVKDVGSEVGTELKNMPGAVYNLGKQAATATGNLASKAMDPKEVEKFKSQMARGWEATQKNPMATAKKGLEILDTGVRSAANMMTFGQADKIAGAANAAVSGGTQDFSKRYEKEKEKEYDVSAARREAYPTAAAVGDVAGLVTNPLFGAGAKAATSLASKAVPKVAQKALAPVAGQTAKNIAKKTVTAPAAVTTGLAGGMTATKAGEKGVEKLDPTDPYYGSEEYRVFEERLKHLINYR